MLRKILSILGFLVMLIVMLIAGIIIKAIGKNIGKSVFAPAKPITQQLETSMIEGFTTAAQQINQQGSMMVDKDTRMDRASVGPGARLTYHYTFPNYSSRDIDSNLLLANLRPAVKKNVCTNEKMKPSLQYGGIFAYAYSGSDKVEVARFEIDRNDCGFAKVQVEQNTQQTEPSSTNSANDIAQRANDLNSQGRYTEAFPLVIQLAEQGNVSWQGLLGYLYYEGQGVTKDYTRAVYWFRKAAEQDDVNAQYSLGVMYKEGRGVARNNNKASYWFKKAAEQGNANARTALNKLVSKNKMQIPHRAQSQSVQEQQNKPSNTDVYFSPSIRGDTNKDGVLSGSEQYLRDN